MRISVCLATYNGQAFIVQQLESILGQLGPEDEVVVSDDASSDATVERITSLGDPRITVHRNRRNLGYSKNFENSLRRATGDLIFVADQDDVWLPDKVVTMVQALEVHDLVVSDVVIVDGDLRETAPSHFDAYGVCAGFLRNFLRTRYIGAAMAMHRRVLDVALPLPGRSDLCAYDYWLACVAELYFDVGLVRRPLMLYRRHDQTASSGGSASPYSVAHRVAVRAYCALQLVRRLRRRRALGSPR